jgi:ATP-binding cassette subfamily C protein
VGAAVLPFQWRRLRRAFRQGRATARGGQTLQAIVSEHVAAMKLAKAHGAEAGLTAHFRAALGHVRAARLALVRQRVLARMGFRITALLGLTVVVWISVTQFGVKGPALLVLVAVFARLVPGFTDVLQNAHVLAEAVSAWAETERQFLPLNAAREAAAGAAPSGSVTFAQVDMTWPGRGEAALRGVNLTLAARRTTALVGPSGAGKTTLADLALGLLTPSGGQICVGGTELRGPARTAWRQKLAYVPQADLLFNDTVRANLLWARMDASEAALWAVLRLAVLEDVVRRLPNGLDSVLGDRGIFLSGGERQRLALARALLREPEFLVLDEATSHLDGANERLIQTALDGLRHRVTLLVIAHRLETVRHADHIVVVEAGRILEQGSWETLVARPGGWLSRAAGHDASEAAAGQDRRHETVPRHA